MTEHIWMTALCVYLRILRSFSENLFYRATYFKFQPTDTVRNYFTSAFKDFMQERQVAIRKDKSEKILKIPENYL